MRKLASVVTVSSIMKMYQKDRIVCVSFEELGYEAIVPNTVKVGDLLAFIQEGSILPVKTEWEFLRKRCFSESVNGFIIRPMKMGKKELQDGSEGDVVKSWGLAVPLNELGLDEKVWKKFKAGEDITEILGIRKYEPEEDASPKKGEGKKAYPKWVKFCLSHKLTRWIGRIWQKKHQNSSGGFPTDLISKSDETTIQNMKGTLEKFKDDTVLITAKMEGQSFTVVPYFKGNKFKGAYVCSRNNAYKLEDNSLFWDMMRKYDVVNKMKKLWKTQKKAYILQGEQVGPGIQDNIYDFKHNHWYLFTVKDYKTLKQVSYAKMDNVRDYFGMRIVPLLWAGKLKEIMPDIDAAVAFAENASWEPIEDDKIHSWIKNDSDKGELWKNYMQHEGVVVRTEDYDKDKNIGVSFKVKNLSYNERGLGNIHKDCINFKNNRS